MLQMSRVLGKVVSTINQPSSVDSFTFWLKSGHETEIEVGNIVTVKDNSSKVYGMVTEMKSYTDADSAMVDYLSHEFGDPESRAPTLRQCIHLATCQVLGASHHCVRPVSSGVVRLATREEIIEAYGMDQIDDPILVGIIPNGQKIDNFAPALLSEEFIIGPEGAHVNFSGASGLATKTSAAVFLIRSILSRAEKKGKKIGVVAFNVKERDLLYLEKNSAVGLEKSIAERDIDQQRKMMEILGEYDVTLEFDESSIKYYAPGRPLNPDVPHSLRQKGVQSFYWSLESVKKKSIPVRLEHMIDPDDLDDRTIGVLSTVEEKLEGRWSDVEHFNSLIAQFPKGQEKWEGHHGGTVAKVKRLIQINTRDILRGLFSYDDAKECDLPLKEELKKGNCVVIDIQTLNDKGKRIVFYNVMKRLRDMLEEYKVIRDQGTKVPLDAVIVFVDELNKFAPHGRTVGRGLKEQILEIASRGRSVGLVLFGAEQFASEIDKEVYGNCSTHFVGRTEHVELGERAYRWIARDLTYIASTLPKGSLLCKHALFSRPLLIRFPKPLHTYTDEEINKLRKKQKPHSREKASKVISTSFDVLNDCLKKKKHQSPVDLYKNFNIGNKLGIGQRVFTQWFKFWISNNNYKTKTKQEKDALKIVIQELLK